MPVGVQQGNDDSWYIKVLYPSLSHFTIHVAGKL